MTKGLILLKMSVCPGSSSVLSTLNPAETSVRPGSFFLTIKVYPTEMSVCPGSSSSCHWPPPCSSGHAPPGNRHQSPRGTTSGCWSRCRTRLGPPRSAGTQTVVIATTSYTFRGGSPRIHVLIPVSIRV